MATLAEIRAKLLQEQNSGGGNQKSSGDSNLMYQFWNTPEGETSVLRFLPDGDPDNVYFWVERLHINLTFNGVKGQDHKPVTVRVPCMEMFEGGICPILSEIRPWFKDSTLEDLARKYWKKRSYLFQGFVVESAFAEENVPENPIRRFAINPSVFEKVKASLVNKDFEDNPTDYIGGRDFKLTKTKKGNYASYDTSSWSFRERALNDAELAAIDTYGLSNLSDALPKRPSEEEVAIIAEMFKDSVDEQAYDVEKFGNYFRPYGVSAPSNNISSSAPASIPQSPKAKAAEAAPAAPQASESSEETGGEDISALIARLNASRNKS